MGDAHGCPKISQWIKPDKTIETHPFPSNNQQKNGISGLNLKISKVNSNVWTTTPFFSSQPLQHPQKATPGRGCSRDLLRERLQARLKPWLRQLQQLLQLGGPGAMRYTEGLGRGLWEPQELQLGSTWHSGVA